jgi:hypothetical protein
MAHFYGIIHGNRGEASRCGTKTSGLFASINSWGIGCDVVIEYDPVRRLDVVTVWKTNGSSSDRGRRRIARFTIPPSKEQTNERNRTEAAGGNQNRRATGRNFRF